MKTIPDRLQSCWNNRRLRLQGLVTEIDIDGILITNSNIFYWLGQSNVTGLLVTRDSLITVNEKELIKLLKNMGKCTLGFDTSLTSVELLQLQNAVPSIRWKSVNFSLSQLLAVKDEIEIMLLRKAARITSQVLVQLGSMIDDERSELELLYRAHEAMLEFGGNNFSFDPSIASGTRSSKLWTGVSTRKLHKGEPVLIDLGVSYRGYNCDMARSYVVGGSVATHNTEWIKAIDTLKEAFADICEHVRPGVRGDELHNLCERTLERAGYSRRMQHCLGHGIGLKVHEPPILGPTSRDILSEGMTIALEPSIILEAKVGFRYENVVLVTKDGCELLTRFQE